MKNGGGHFAPELGGHFELESGGHFKLELGGHFKLELGGQYDWNLQLRVVMDGQTGVLSSHASDEILERHYIDPTILSAVEKAVMGLKVFG